MAEHDKSGSFFGIALTDVLRQLRSRIESNGDGSATISLADGRDSRVARRRAAEVRALLQG